MNNVQIVVHFSFLQFSDKHAFEALRNNKSERIKATMAYIYGKIQFHYVMGGWQESKPL